MSQAGSIRVMVTGGTGFMGSHLVRALLDRGDEVVALVRNRDRLVTALGAETAQRVDIVVGDVTDDAAVSTAVGQSDAVVHAAGMVGIDASMAAELQRVNAGGTRLVLSAAAARGLDPIVFVSSIAALFPPSGAVLRAADEVHTGRSPYSRSKADAELCARELQAGGAPVTTLYPGAVWGPQAPTLGEPIEALAAIVRSPVLVLPDTPGGMPTVDVREVTATLLATLEPGRGPRRFMLGGTFLTMAMLGELLEDLTGRRVRMVPGPGAVIRAAGRVGDVLRRALPLRFPLTLEAMEQLTRMVPTDDAPTFDALGVSLRPLRDTMADTLRWLVAAGHLKPNSIGTLAA